MLKNGILSQVISDFGQIAIACIAVVSWQKISNSQIKWFLIGAALWGIAVFLKVLSSRMVDGFVFRFLRSHLPYPLLVAGGGLFTGAQSSLFEMGITLLAVRTWPLLGNDAQGAIAIGVGAGAVEAFLLGISGLIGGIVIISGWSKDDVPKEEKPLPETSTSLCWLLAPVERIIATLCHASCRALILLGAVHGTHSMIFWGFTLFALLDGVAGAVHISGKIQSISLWWIELMLTPFAIVSVFVLMWCYKLYSY